jgi:mono/diheme cytochrome c family protein
LTAKRSVCAALTLIVLVVMACGGGQATPQPEAPALPQPTAEPTTPAVSRTPAPQPTQAAEPQVQQAAGIAAYEKSCSGCHGNNLEDGFSAKLSRAALADYGTALELYEYLRSAMPKGNAGSLPEQEYYDITGYLLFRQGLLSEGQVVDPGSAPNIRLSE